MHGILANGLGILREQMIMSVVQATINIPLSLIFARRFGMGSSGVLLGTNCSLLVSCIVLPVLLYKKIERKCE